MNILFFFSLENYEIYVWKIFGMSEKGRGNGFKFKNNGNRIDHHSKVKVLACFVQLLTVDTSKAVPPIG